MAEQNEQLLILHWGKRGDWRGRDECRNPEHHWLRVL